MAEQVAAVTSFNTATARMAFDAARTDHKSADQLLSAKLQACEISRVQAEAAIAHGEGWIAAEQTRLDTIREAVATARVAYEERQRSAREHEVTNRPEQTREEIAVALKGIDERRLRASERFIEASTILRNDDQARSRMAEITVTLDQ